MVISRIRGCRLDRMEGMSVSTGKSVYREGDIQMFLRCAAFIVILQYLNMFFVSILTT
jgi:hypothetical protein